jgi:hypothetical protein
MVVGVPSFCADRRGVGLPPALKPVHVDLSTWISVFSGGGE